MKSISTLTYLLGWTAAHVLPRAAAAAEIDYSNVTFALVRAPPAGYPYPPPSEDWFGRKHDLNATVDLGIHYIERAAQEGANFVAFPEVWFPGHFTGAVGPNGWLPHYLEQGLVVGSLQWEKLLAAARANHVWLALGFAQRDGDHIYMGQALVDSQGEVIQLRQKLRPSGGERTVFSDGTIDQLQVFQTPFGRLGQLECWEHMHPTMTNAIQAQMEDIHIAPFPWAPALGATSGLTSAEISLTGARFYAATSATYVFMPAIGTAAVIHPNGTTVAFIEASECPIEKPLLYYSLNTTEFAGTPTYDVNSEFSWAALQQMNDAYPKYIPQVPGNFTGRRLISVEELKVSGPVPLNYNYI